MKKIVLISGHDAQAKRKTGFHFWAQILSERGHKVRFVTVGASYFSLLKEKDLVRPYNQWVDLNADLKKFTWLPPIHPFFIKNRCLDKFFCPIFHRYAKFLPNKVLREVADADIYIIENGAGVMLMPRLIKNSPNAKFVYNVSDRLGMLYFHPIVIEQNKQYAEYFSFIRLNAQDLANDFHGLANILYIPQGIDKVAFDQENKNPYTTPLNIISVGDTLFDPFPIDTLAKNFPDWHFHLFGRRAFLNKIFKNVTQYGETSFEKIIPYIKHADGGLATYYPHPDANYLAQSSLKTTQYTYCQLPILSPSFTKMDRDHIFGYDPQNQESICNAFEAMTSFDRRAIDKNQVLDWNDVIDQILENA